MIPPVCLRLLQIGELFGREQPVPDTLLCRMRIFVLSCVDQKHSRIVPFQVSLVQVFQRVKRRSEFRENRFRKRHRSVFASLAVMNGADPRINIQTLHPELHTFRKPPPAAIQQLHHQIIRRRQMLKNRLKLLTRSHHRTVGFALRPEHPFHRPKFLVQHMPVKK